MTLSHLYSCNSRCKPFYRWFAESSALILGIFLAMLLLWSQTVETCQLVVDMTVIGDRSTYAGDLEVWINDTDRKPFVQPVRIGERVRYEIPVTDRYLSFLRIDPVTTPNMSVVIHGVDVMAKRMEVRHFRAAELSKWSQVNIHPNDLGPDGYTITSQNHDPYLFTNFEAISLPQSFWVNLKWFLQESSEKLLRPFVITVAVVLFSGILGGRGRQHCLMILILLMLLFVTITLFRSLEGWAPATSKCVGWASYNNYPKWLDNYCVPILLMLPLLVATASFVVFRHLFAKRDPTQEGEESVPIGSEQSKAGAVTVFISLIVLFMYLLPDLAGTLNGIFTQAHKTHWDSDNLIVWESLIKNGALPYRDFWYPYAGMYFWNLPFPIGPLIQFLHQYVLWTVLVLSIYLCTNRHAGQTVIMTGIILVCVHLETFHSFYRQGPILACILSFAAIDENRNDLQLAHGLFWTSVLLGFYVEPLNLLLAAGIPIFFYFAIELVFVSPRSFWRLSRVGLVATMPPLFAFTFTIIYLWHLGLLPGIVQFYENVPEIAIRASIPAFVESWLRFVPVTEAFVFFSGSILFATGLFGFLSEKGFQKRLSFIILALGMASVLILSKLMIRPGGMAHQISFLPVSGIMFYLVWGQIWMNRIQRLGTFAAVGLMVGLIWSTGAVGESWTRIRTGPVRLLSDARMFLISKEVRNQIVQKEFNQSRFLRSAEYVSATNAIRSLLTPGSTQGLFILSDDPVLYLTTGQTPPYSINNYDACSLTEQLQICRWLDSAKPHVVVWNTKYSGVDGVPLAVRNPLTLESVILSYVPSDELGPIAILQRRGCNQNVPVGFWREHLGAQLDIAHIAQNTSFSQFHQAESKQCSDFLVVRLTEKEKERVSLLFARRLASVAKSPLHICTARSESFTIPVEVDGYEFAIIFRISAPKRESVIFLDRVWFWGALKKVGYEPRLGPIPEGLQVQIVKKAPRDDVLY